MKRGVNLFALLGSFTARRPWRVLIIWLLAFGFAVLGARKAPALLLSGSGDIPGSPSLRADSLLRHDFKNPYTQTLLLALSAKFSEIPQDSASGLWRTLEKRLLEVPHVIAVMAPDKIPDKRLRPRPGTGKMILIGVQGEGVLDAEQAIPKVRRAIEGVLAPYRAEDPGYFWAVTGRSALSYDLNAFNARDVHKAEGRIIPFTLLILLFAFASITAAGIPVLLAVMSTTLTLGCVFLLSHFWNFSNLVQNVSSMIGLAVGIDYSLFFIHRYRGILAAGNSDRIHALTETMSTAGRAIFFSGLTVMIGFGGLIVTPLLETRSMGWGGCLVVFISVAASLTLLPALLILLGDAIHWPRFLSGMRIRQEDAWRAWSRWVLRKAGWAILIGLSALLLLSAPGRHTRFGFPEGEFLPPELEFVQGHGMLQEMGLEALADPINIILTSRDGGPVLTSDRLPALYAFSGRIRGDSSVSGILGPLDLADDLPLSLYQSLYENPASLDLGAPIAEEFYLSRDGKSMLMQVLLKPATSLEQSKKLAERIPGWMRMNDLKVDLGGQAVYYNDFDRAMIKAYPVTVIFVFSITLLVLLAMFRSPLVALKALIMNVLSVLAGYGAVVWVFQLGHGAWIFGLPGPTEMVPITIPLLLFCIIFGLSMDYEVFLLSTIREWFQKTGDNALSVQEGLASTGSVITSAALIMVVVFGAFAFARVVLVQMLGLGLAVAVLVDATIIRVLLVPALMKVAGRWNWWPWWK